MFTREKATSNEFISNFIEDKKETLLHIFEEDELKFDTVAESLKSKAKFWLKIVEEQYNAFRWKAQKHCSFYDIDFTPLVERFSPCSLAFIIAHCDTYINRDLENFFKKVEPMLQLVDNIRLSEWQWYMENNITPLEVESIYNKLSDLPQPFDDSRFSAYPIHCDCYQKGRNRSEWLQDKKGAISKYYDRKLNKVFVERDETAYGGIFIDAKLGIVIYFKDLPSITISFNVDGNKNLYIHQIQATKKDRGHYKLKGDWRLHALNYIKAIFPDYTFHLLSGDNIAELVLGGYSEDSPEGFKPNKTCLERIKETYDNLLPEFNSFFDLSGMKYRQIKI